ncbi:MAG: chitobiase/beta-hexosaminidase C-terminal domain-containing protein, partial [Clostridiales bacterium]|nr:chitobiase/beta-hexosaminidase C-terminal domain-containing protein [Clostridiales bacterium]
HSMPDGSLTCDNCGTYLGRYASANGQDTGVRAIRQGRVSASSPTLPSDQGRMREYGDYDLSALPVEDGQRAPRRKPAPAYQSRRGSSRPDTRRGVPVNAHGRSPALKSKHVRVRPVKRHNVNWMLIGVAVTLVLVIAGGAFYVYMSRSDSGQRAAARRNTLAATEGMFTLAQNTKDPLVQEECEALLKQWSGVPAQAYWLAGQEYMDVGDVQSAIVCFRIGDVVEPENYDGLLLLANAYEMDNQDGEAEALYLRLANEVSPFRSEAYTALIRMYQAQGRGPEAADMMLTAYQNTDRETYRLQRKEYIPLMPETSLAAGRYEISKMEENIALSSPQGYDIYYTVDDEAILPQDGALCENGQIIPKEGSVTLRAVCVSGKLVSDELRVSYTFYYPTPPAPKCNLAPNTYKTKRDVSLRPGELQDVSRKEAAEAASHYRYFYTIDGSTPTEESPEYDGTPIQLPSGRVTLKAVCVNQYGKMSTMLEVGYKFNTKPDLLDKYQETDTFSGFKLNQTSVDEFTAAFGKPQREVETTYLGLENQARHLDYDWGYAVFILENGAWQVVRVEMNRQIATAPRGVGFGSTEDEIAAVYKDFGQLRAANGTRGLYYDYPDVGQVLVNGDGTRTVKYSCQISTSKVWVLEYHLGASGRVDKIINYYQP